MKYRIQTFTSKQKGKTYTYQWFGYSYRDKVTHKPAFKCLVNLSALPQDVLEKLREQLADGKELEMEHGDVSFLGASKIGPEAVAMHLAEELGITDALSCMQGQDASLVMAMVLDRVIQPFPHSRKGLFENLPGSPLARVCGVDCDALKREHLYYALDRLLPLQDRIEKQLYSRNEQAGNKMYLYDITSSYFEGNSCPLEAFGYNRDRKQGKKQIVIGMLTSHDGRPVSVEVFEGNTSDQTTVMARIESMKQKFNLEELVFIGDRGMLTNTRRSDLTADEFKGVKYITALSREEFVRFVEDSSHPLQLSLFDRNNLAEVTHDGVKYVLSYNPDLEERNRNDRARLLEKTEKFLAGIKQSVEKKRLRKKDLIAKRLFTKLDKWKCAKFYSVTYDEGCFDYARKDDVIESYKSMDGFYVFVTDKLDLTAKETREEYRGLQKVEQTFRTMKGTELFIRPIRLWNPDRVKAHVFVCMLAYMVIWKARKVFQEFEKPEGDLRVSLRHVWEMLEQVEIGRIKIGDEIQEQFAPMEKEVKNILKAAGLSASTLAKRYLKTDM